VEGKEGIAKANWGKIWTD